jgi:hypothetical protein
VRVLAWSVGFALATLVARAQVPRPLAQPPVTLEFDACVLPSEACTDRHDVMTLIVRGATRMATLTNLRVVTSTQPRGSMRIELTERPLRVYAPDALLDQLTPGARLHVRATTRLHTRDLLLEALRPLDDASDG